MNDGFQWWLVIVGIGLGAGLLWLVMGRLPREDADVRARERAAEAAWISETIESGGGIAPVALVEEILELHAQYLEGPPALVEPSADTADVVADDGRVRLSDRATAVTAAVVAQERDPWLPDTSRVRPPLSVGNGPSVERHDARREAPEADVRQAG
jgi:hypothetical protein